MLSEIREKIEPWVESSARPFARIGLQPNHITLIALLTGLLAGVLFAYEEPQWAGIAILVGGFFDMIDGAVARLTDQVTEFGGVLDSVSDRVTDFILYIGVMFGGMSGVAELPSWFLPALALAGSFLVSYTRARAESAGTGKLEVGIAERAERLLILGVGAFFCVTAYALLIIVVLTIFTIVQRVWEARSRLE